MPKAGAGTPKAIANRAKAKGLQKLKWYCQMCQKQCRDENGFKCHTMSESHLRQMRVYSENSTSIMEDFSQEFEESYLETLHRLHGTKRVRANQIYQEVIANKTHIHMNSTKWDTLTTFVKYLGKQGHCLVDETEKGWFVQFIDRSYLKRKEELDKLKKADLDEETRQQRLMAARAEAARQHLEAAGKLHDDGPRELQRDPEDGAKIVITTNTSLAASGSAAGNGGAGGAKRPRPNNVFGGGDDDEEDGGGAFGKKAKALASAASSAVGAAAVGGGKKSELERLMEMDAQRKQREEATAKSKEVEERTENWLSPGIVVKIINKKLGGGKYYKQKGRVERVLDKFVGEVSLLESGGRLRIDQEELESVIPAVGGAVLILNGKGKGLLAELLELDVDKYAARVRVLEGSLKGEVVKGVAYEDISKADRDFLRR